jgi:hypothetical protein
LSIVETGLIYGAVVCPFASITDLGELADRFVQSPILRLPNSGDI